MYVSSGLSQASTCTRSELIYGVTLKIHKKSNFDWNQLKLGAQHKSMYMYQKKNIKMKNSLLVIFGEIWPNPLYYSTVTLT